MAYAWAYAQAVESVSGTTPPERALWLRGLLLELERLHNHLGDLDEPSLPLAASARSYGRADDHSVSRLERGRRNADILYDTF